MGPRSGRPEIRCPKISGVRCPLRRIASLATDARTRSNHHRLCSPVDELNRLWCWLARKDSNLRSPDPESGDRFSRFFAHPEHETHRFLPPVLPSLVTHRKRGQVATSGLPDSPAPIRCCMPERIQARGCHQYSHPDREGGPPPRTARACPTPGLRQELLRRGKSSKEHRRPGYSRHPGRRQRIAHRRRAPRENGRPDGVRPRGRWSGGGRSRRRSARPPRRRAGSSTPRPRPRARRGPAADGRRPRRRNPP
jgi:hypothetical protein